MLQKIIERENFSQIADHLKKPEITVILGPRQSGKTTLLFQLQEFLQQVVGVRKEQIRFFNLDIVQDAQYFRDQTTILDLIRRDATPDSPLYLFVDEAQRIPNPGLFFKGIYDAHLSVKIVLTGSSALEIKAKIAEPLTGRKRIFLLPPFSFGEYLRARAPELIPLLALDPRRVTAPEHDRLVRAFTAYLVTGGYPAAVLAEHRGEEQSKLQEIVNSYIEKDIVGFLAYQDRAAFATLLRLLAAQTGSLVNTNELARTVGVSRATIERHLAALDATFITTTLRPYAKNLRKIIRKMPKIYFLDAGVRNTMLHAHQPWGERTDQGALLEMAVARLLWETFHDAFDLFFLRTVAGAEADFLFPGPPPVLIEVKVRAPKTQELQRLIRLAVLVNARRIILVTLAEGVREVVRENIAITSCPPWHLTTFLPRT